MQADSWQSPMMLITSAPTGEIDGKLQITQFI